MDRGGASPSRPPVFSGRTTDRQMRESSEAKTAEPAQKLRNEKIIVNEAFGLALVWLFLHAQIKN